MYIVVKMTQIVTKQYLPSLIHNHLIEGHV